VEIPDGSGGEVHVFDADGRHLSTRDAITGVTTWTFGYDSEGRLISATDRNGRVTTIQRDGNGVATLIVSPGNPYPVVTNLTVTDGDLVEVTDANNHSYSMTYGPTGLLETLTDPRDYLHEFEYSDGRLVLDSDPG